MKNVLLRGKVIFWTIGGILLGLFFPFFSSSLMDRPEMLFYVICTAPLFLGSLSFLVGFNQERFLVLKKTEDEKEKAYGWMDLVLKSAGLEVWEWDLKENIVLFNSELKHNLSRFDQKSYSFPLMVEEFIHPEDKDEMIKKVYDYIQGRATEYVSIYRMKDFQGKWRWVQSNGKVSQRDKQGHPICFLGTHFDITERKNREIEINEKNDELEHLIEAISELAIVSVTDRKGKITRVNKMFCEISGYSEKELLGQDHRIVKSGVHEKKMFKEMWEKILKGENWIGDIQNRKKNGSYYFVRTIIIPLLKQGGINSFFSIRFDMTKQVQLAKNLAEAQKLSKIGSWTLNTNTFEVDLSDQMYEIFPWNNEERKISFDDIYSMVHPEDQEHWRKAIDNAILTKKSCEIRFRSIGKEEIIWAKAIIKIMMNKEGGVTRLYGTCQDITEQVLAEEEIQKERFKTIHTSKLASLGEMSAGIAHEINNPLTIITGNLPLLEKIKKEGEETKFKDRIEKMIKASERISKIVRGLKKLVRFQVDVEHKEELISSLIEESLVICDIKALKTDVKIDYKIQDEENLIVKCNEVEIEQVLINLINNAIDAVEDREERWVKINAFRDTNTEVVIQVVNSGPRIEEKVEEKIFQPFFTTKPVGKGTGLGLSISKGILDQHGASLSLNKSFENTCFEIRFPS